MLKLQDGKKARTHLKIRFHGRDTGFLRRGDAADAEPYRGYGEAEPQAAAKNPVSEPKWNFGMGSRYLWGLVPLVFFGSLSIYAFLYLSPERIIDFIGVNNAYALIFFLAFLGGLTTFSGVPYHLVLVAFAAGGMNPMLLGLSAAAGVMLGDSTSYYAGMRGGMVAPRAIRGIFEQIYSFSEKHPILLPLFCFLYGALVPFSNDFITISAGIARYSFRRVMIPLGLGNIVFNVALAWFAAGAYQSI